jgi:hypothetical protein
MKNKAGEASRGSCFPWLSGAPRQYQNDLGALRKWVRSIDRARQHWPPGARKAALLRLVSNQDDDR